MTQQHTDKGLTDEEIEDARGHYAMGVEQMAWHRRWLAQRDARIADLEALAQRNFDRYEAEISKRISTETRAETAEASLKEAAARPSWDIAISQVCAVIKARREGNMKFAEANGGVMSPVGNKWIDAALECDVLLHDVLSLRSEVKV